MLAILALMLITQLNEFIQELIRQDTQANIKAMQCLGWLKVKLVALQIYFPIECHIKARGITRSSQKWWWLQALSLLTLLITIASLIGSVEFVVQDLKVRRARLACRNPPDTLCYYAFRPWCWMGSSALAALRNCMRPISLRIGDSPCDQQGRVGSGVGVVVVGW